MSPDKIDLITISIIDLSEIHWINDMKLKINNDVFNTGLNLKKKFISSAIILINIIPYKPHSMWSISFLIDIFL